MPGDLAMLKTPGTNTRPACSCLFLAVWEGSGRLSPRRHNNSRLTDCLSPLPEPRFPLASPVSYVPRRSAFFNR